MVSPELKKRVAAKAYNSLITIAVSGSVWITTELSCNYIKYHIFLLGHPLWHFIIGHGFYNLIQVVYFIKINDAKYALNYNKMYLLYRTPSKVY